MFNEKNNIQSVVCSAVEIAYHGKVLLGECPRWDEKTQSLYWVDIDQNHLHRFNPETGNNETITFNEKIGCFALRENGGFILGMQSGFAMIDSFDNNINYLCDPESDKKDNRFNDGRCDFAGRFIAGTLNMKKSDNDASIYQLSPDDLAHPVRLKTGLLTSNGIAFSLCGSTMYFGDTPNHIVYQAPYDIDTGKVGETQVYQKFDKGKGRPDGAAVDTAGFYWSAQYNGAEVVRISPNGNVVERVKIPAKHCTMLAFGDSDLKTVYVTTASSNLTTEEQKQYPHSGAIFKFRTTIAGQLEYRFKG